MNIFRKVEKEATKFGAAQILLNMNDYAQHTVTGMVGRVVGVADIDGDRKLTVELPNGKTLKMLSHREFCLANSAEYMNYARTARA